MFDSINGYVVECFPIAHCIEGMINYTHGEYRNYEVGSEVPFKRPYYNYGRNFVIVDISHIKSNAMHSFVIHVIENGRVKATYQNEIGEIQWENVQSVVNYHGKFLNIRSSSELENFIKNFGEYKSNWELELEHLYDVTSYGEYMYAYTQSAEDDEYCKNMIAAMISVDNTLPDRYNTWQQSSDYIENFNEREEK